MSTNTLNITMDQGSSLSYAFTMIDASGNPFDLTGYDARLQVRRTYGATTPFINCTLANGKVAITSLNVITLVLAPSDTSGERFDSKDDDTLDCVYDLEIIGPLGKVYKPARGTLTLNREVTR